MIVFDCPHCGQRVRLQLRLESCVEYCDECGESFQKLREGQRFCSTECLAKFKADANKVRECTSD